VNKFIRKGEPWYRGIIVKIHNDGWAIVQSKNSRIFFAAAAVDDPVYRFAQLSVGMSVKFRLRFRQGESDARSVSVIADRKVEQHA
jgi:hypothetical protein